MKKGKLLNFARFIGGALLPMFLLSSCSEQDIVEPSLNSIITEAKVYTAPGADPCAQVCLVAGQNMNVGTVDVAVANNGNLFVTYRITKPGIYLSEVHADVFSSVEQLKSDKKLSNGGAIPGKFAFKKSWGSKSKEATFTIEIPKAYVNQKSLGNDCFFIASHATLTNGETAWGGMCEESAKGVSLYKAKQFPGNNWGVFFDFCINNCVSEVDFTYAWEDWKNGQNDGDYNDLVIQADVKKLNNALKLAFFASARGAYFEHQFKIKIPKTGIESISGAAKVVEKDGYYYITVFNSTKTLLPGNINGFANTEQGYLCNTINTKELVLTTNSSFNFNKDKPYEPLISVFQDGVVKETPDYDLYIYEVSGPESGTFMLNEKLYPNGIIIPKDWRWPLEHIFIGYAYPRFTSLTEGFNPDWAVLVNPEYSFDKTVCK